MLVTIFIQTDLFDVDGDIVLSLYWGAAVLVLF